VFKVEFRRNIGSDIWHWCENCSDWPMSNYESSHLKPTSGEYCDQCKSKDPNSRCY
jgi:hypothetical protein